MICILSEHQNCTSHLIKGQIQADLNYLSDLKANFELEKWPQSWPPPPWSSSWPHFTAHAHTPCQPWAHRQVIFSLVCLCVWSCPDISQLVDLLSACWSSECMIFSSANINIICICIPSLWKSYSSMLKCIFTRIGHYYDRDYHCNTGMKGTFNCQALVQVQVRAPVPTGPQVE